MSPLQSRVARIALLIGLCFGMEAAIAAPGRVAVLELAEPSIYDAKVMEYDVPNPAVTLPGRLVGEAFGAVLRGADQASRNYRLTEAFRAEDFRLSEAMTASLVESFEARGYEVERVKVPGRITGHFASAPALEGFDVVVDAYIDFAGYLALTPTTPYVPRVEVPVQIREASSGRVLSEAVLAYGGPVPVEGATDVPADPRFAMRRLSQFEQDPARAIGGMVDAADSLSQIVGRLAQTSVAAATDR